MVKIRFALTKNPRVFRIVAIDSRSPRDGRALGYYGTVDRCAKQKIVTIKKDEIIARVKLGAQMSPAVARLLAREGLIDPIPQPVHTKKHLPKKDAK